MQIGDYVNTPRFLKVQIKEVFTSQKEAYKQGFCEPTHYDNENYDIFGNNIGENRMIFAAVLKNNKNLY